MLPDATICALVADAYTRDTKLGLLCEVLMGDRHAAGAGRANEGRLPDRASERAATADAEERKGRRQETGPRRSARPTRCRSAVGLAKKLKQAAAGRAEDDRCCCALTASHGTKGTSCRLPEPFAEIVKALGLNAKITAYCFRHSLDLSPALRGVPTPVVAANHDTQRRR